jgi:hypothetical protein
MKDSEYLLSQAHAVVRESETLAHHDVSKVSREDLRVLIKHAKEARANMDEFIEELEAAKEDSFERTIQDLCERHP